DEVLEAVGAVVLDADPPVPLAVAALRPALARAAAVLAAVVTAGDQQPALPAAGLAVGRAVPATPAGVERLHRRHDNPAVPRGDVEEIGAAVAGAEVAHLDRGPLPAVAVPALRRLADEFFAVGDDLDSLARVLVEEALRDLEVRLGLADARRSHQQ